MTSTKNIKIQEGFSFLLFIIIIATILVGGLIWYFVKGTLKNNTTQLTQTSQSVNQKGVLYIGETIDENGLQTDTQEFQPFINYLVSKLKNQGITSGQFVGTHSVSEMAELVLEGKIDVVVDSPFPVYVVDKLAGGQILADRWKGGVESYHSAFFVKDTSTIQTLDDLKGKIIAMDGSTSTAGYFLPKAYLIQKGYKISEKNSPTDPVSPDEIGYVFVGAKVYDDVTHGITAAGVENDQEIRDYFGSSFSQYRYIITTPDIMRFAVATRGDMDPNLRNSIGNILFSMDHTAEGKHVLKTFANTTKFTPVTNTDSSYNILQDLSDLVESEIVKQ